MCYIRKGIFLPQQFGRKSLINRLLFPFGASASLAAIHYLGTFHFIIPGSRQDVMSCALSVLYHSCHLKITKNIAHKKRSALIRVFRFFIYFLFFLGKIHFSFSFCCLKMSDFETACALANDVRLGSHMRMRAWLHTTETALQGFIKYT